MKKLLFLLLVPFSAFAQVSIENGICSTVADNGNTVEWGCAEVLPDPDPAPEPEPEGYSKIVAFGDSWTDDDRYTPWAETLANELGVPIENYAVSGARSWQIENQVAQAVSQGIDPNALYTYWIFPNDFYDYGYVPENAYPAIEQNARDAFRMLTDAGATNILILTLPRGEYIPLFSAYGSYGTTLTDGANARVEIAASEFGLSMYPSGDFINQLQTSGQNCWYDQQHLCRATHDRLAAEIAGGL